MNSVTISQKLTWLYEKKMESYKIMCKIKGKKIPKKLTCKEIAKRVGVTQATISNINENSKFSLIFKIAEVIYNYYYEYFEYQTQKNYLDKAEDESYTRCDLGYVMLWVTDIY